MGAPAVAGACDQVTVADVTVPTRHGDVPARLYTAASSHRRRIIVFPGIHAGGVDEPRLDTFVARLAGEARPC